MMNLQDELDALRARLRTSLDPADRTVVTAAIERLRMLQLVEHGLAVGDVLPDFALADAASRTATSDQLLTVGPLVVNFFRGGWCPYCSLALQALDELMPAVEGAGGSLVAIAPAEPAELARLAIERRLRLRMLSDPGAAYARLCGLDYAMSDGQAAYYRRHGVDLDPPEGRDWHVPVPASYVVGRDGVIRHAFADPDWSRRAEPAELLDALRRLQAA